MHKQRKVNPNGIFRTPRYGWSYAIDTARRRGGFTRPSDVVREIFDLGLAAHASRESEEREGARPKR